VNSPLRWFGGKKYFLKFLLPFPQHILYVEPFGGSSVVLLNKEISPFEVYNDINKRLVNFWSIIKERYYELQFLINLRGDLDSRELFEKYKDPSEDQLEDAMRFFYVNRHSFSGKNDTYMGISHKEDKIRYSHDTYLKEIERLSEIYNRIKNIHFECQDFRKLLKRSDVPNALWYLDPPYFKGGEQYEKGIGGKEWNQQDFEDLREILYNIKNAKFILSIDSKEFYNHPDWFYEKIERQNKAANTGDTQSIGIEYIIRNFDPSKIEVMKNKKQMSLEAFQ